MEKRKEGKSCFILVVLLVSGCIGFFMLYNSFMQDKVLTDSMPFFDFVLYRQFNGFNYFRGLWLMPMSIFFVFLLLFLDLPSFKTVIKMVKKDFEKKRKEIRRF